MNDKSLPLKSIFDCACGNHFPSPSSTRAKCPQCGAFVRSHVPIPTEFSDPRRTLSDVQDALSAIAFRAKNQNANEIDVAMARTFTDSMKYLTPALEASFNVNKNDDAFLEKMVIKLNAATDAPPVLPARHQDALPGRDQQKVHE